MKAEKPFDNFPEFFDHLQSRMGTRADPRASIERLSEEELVDLAVDLAIRTPTSVAKTSSRFDFVANKNLSGGPDVCQFVECRVAKADQLARYAALYADHVVSRSPFDDYIPTLRRLLRSRGREFDRQLTWFKSRMFDDLILLRHLEPTLRSGSMTFAITPGHYCNACYEYATGERADAFTKRIKELRKAARCAVIERSEFRFSMGKYGHVVSTTSDDMFGGHEAWTHFRKKLPISRKSLKAGREYKLSTAEASRIGLIDRWVDQIIEDMVSQNLYALAAGCQYLTDRPLDFRVILGSDVDQPSTDTRALFAGLGHSLPFIDGVPLDRLLRLRTEEPEAFAVYRDALNSVLAEARGKPAAQIKKLVRDRVEPELNRIDLAVKRSKKLLWDGLVRDVIYGTGFVTAGIWAGALSHDAGAVLAALGGFQTISGVLRSASTLRQTPEAARDERFYFLWKVKQASVHR